MYHKKIISRLKLLGGLSHWNEKALGKDREENGARIWDSRSKFGLGTADIQDCSSFSLMPEKYTEFYYENMLDYSQHRDKNKLKSGVKITQV